MAIGTGLAILGGSLLSGAAGLIGSKKAAKAQRKGAEAGIAEQRRQFDTIIELTQPGRDVGNAALNQLAGIFGVGGDQIDANTLSETFRNLPGSQFLINEAERGVGASFASRGGAFGGNAVRALGERIGGLAENQVINRLLQLAGFGPQATGQAVAGTTGVSNNITQLLGDIGGARASGFLGAAGSVNNAIQGGLSNFLLLKALPDIFGKKSGGGGAGSVTIPGGVG